MKICPEITLKTEIIKYFEEKHVSNIIQHTLISFDLEVFENRNGLVIKLNSYSAPIFCTFNTDIFPTGTPDIHPLVLTFEVLWHFSWDNLC